MSKKLTAEELNDKIDRLRITALKEIGSLANKGLDSYDFDDMQDALRKIKELENNTRNKIAELVMSTM